MTNFQTAITGIFIFCIVIGVLMFSGVIKTGKDRQAAAGSVVMWGTLDGDTVRRIVSQFNAAQDSIELSYVERPASSFDQDLIEALARGQGPDLILLSNDSIIRHDDKVQVVPYASYPERQFRDTFLQEGELYLTSEGVLGFPLSVDPLVMYYNRQLLESAGIATPPRYWDEFPQLALAMTKRDASGNLTQSFVALGESSNVDHAKDILAALMLQLGNGIVERRGQAFASTLSSSFGRAISPAESALDFYAEFANPASTSYSWNKAEPSSLNAFIAGDTAVYLGYASELFAIQERNPNLDFDVAKLPQVRGAQAERTFGRMHAVSVLKTSRNVRAAYAAATALSAGTYSDALALALSLPPVKRSSLSVRPSDSPYGIVFYNSALIARGWLEPSRADAADIFGEMIDNVSSGRLTVSEAVSRAHNRLGPLLR